MILFFLLHLHVNKIIVLKCTQLQGLLKYCIEAPKKKNGEIKLIFKEMIMRSVLY